MICKRLEGRSVIVTGGASGVGRATAKRFAEEGAKTVCLFDLHAENLHRVADEVRERGAEVIEFVGNVTSTDDCQRAVQMTVAAAGALDVLVSNAPAHSAAPFLEMSLEEWERVLRVNLTASFVLGQCAARSMVEAGRGGSILYTASVSSLGASTSYAHYGASKAGIVNLAKTMALELVDYGIRVNTVSPGPLDTPQSLVVLGSEEAMERARQHWPLVPMGRLGLPEEIAAAFAYLASPDAAYVTGHNLVVDGGLTAHAYSIPKELLAE
jgi:glucose 1-dehydrogenase